MTLEIAFELVGLGLLVLAVFSTFNGVFLLMLLTWRTALNANTLFALAVVVALLLPSGRCWFHA
jgi:hypothetical protein